MEARVWGFSPAGAAGGLAALRRARGGAASGRGAGPDEEASARGGRRKGQGVFSPAGGLSEGAPGKQAGCPVRAGVATGKGTGSAGW